ncbi:MAG: hypothetical protein EOP56_04255 [Sphingobacteriales bacterium]|nr:MAG: hypothetical protein EOP56_04255 [Sphingobacteriales bacterium]
MQNTNPGKWRKYLNMLLSINAEKPAATDTDTFVNDARATEGNAAPETEHKSSTERFIHARGREVYMAAGNSERPELEYCRY